MRGNVSASRNVFKKTIPVYFLEIQEISITLRTEWEAQGAYVHRV